jgi:hypothetical protein
VVGVQTGLRRVGGLTSPTPRLREALVDYGNSPDNTYSQGVQELNASAGAC